MDSDKSISTNLRAFLDCVAFSELGPDLLAQSDRGYDVIVGSRPGRVNRFTNYADHPRQLITLHISSNPDGIPVTIRSTAAGRYQVLARYWDVYRHQLNLPDFGPASQDKIAIQLMGECMALDDIDDGRFETAVHKCASRWASLPTKSGVSAYGQPVRSMDDLRKAYVQAGGALAYSG